ncbi:hypothetical protein GCM10023220_24400 [Streptomyces ziwulingensis]|uniref:Uncharacterized protein n=1 Tax=Streptomyces ziwulingensis TaxID=1045501 RepID=A0ABP9BKJ7_9ACTN
MSGRHRNDIHVHCMRDSQQAGLILFKHVSDPVSGPFREPAVRYRAPAPGCGRRDRSAEQAALRGWRPIRSTPPHDRCTTGGTGVDPISASLLVAAASGAGGEMGRQLWDALRGLVRRGPADETPTTPDPAPGEAELVSLSQAPHSAERARALSEALSRRAAQDAVFGARLTEWGQQAQVLHAAAGDTRNTVSGGTQHGPLLQGRDFSGITFQAPDQGQGLSDRP